MKYISSANKFITLKSKSMNCLIVIICGILAVALIVFLVIRNQKDEKDFEKELNNDYPKSRSEHGDIEIDKLTDSVH